MTELVVGQKLWFVAHRRYTAPKEVTVSKVGRKWATIGDDRWNSPRVDKATLMVDGGNYSSPGRCYLSQEVYEAEQRVVALWNGFHCKVRDKYYHRPGGVTVEAIQAAAALLGITLDEVKP